ncbi:MAG: succinate dehydrogenase cytochrome b subunit [Armatimonadetes bacterium]|nr:succinate dehydrogenase cytochrome b subunit [Armatimonadota bacterium]
MGQLLCALIKSSIGRKFLMAITGLGAIGFLTVHLGGNLFVYAGKDAFNTYAHHLHAIPFLFVFEAGLFAMFATHLLFAGILTIHNWQSRRIPYSTRKTAGGSNLASSTMIYSGLAVLAFIIIHLMTVKTGHAGMGAYERVVYVLSHPNGVITYVLGVLALGLHLFHGASSTFQSIGINHPKYANVVTCLGRIAAVIMAVAFSSIPLYVWIVLSKG